MKKRLIKWGMISLVSLVVVFVRYCGRSAKAAEATPAASPTPSPSPEVTMEPLYIPDWALTGFDTATPVPDQENSDPFIDRSFPTPAPSEYIHCSNCYRISTPNTSNLNIVQYDNIFGSSHIDDLPRSPWMLDNGFRSSSSSISYDITYSSFSNQQGCRIPVKWGAYEFTTRIIPPTSVPFSSSFNLDCIFSSGLSIQFVNPNLASITELELTPLDFYDLPCSAYAFLYNSSGDLFAFFESGYFTWGDLISSGIPLHIEWSEPDITISFIDLVVTLDSTRPWSMRDLLSSYYRDPDVGLSTWPVGYLSGDVGLSCSVRISQNPKADDRSWLTKLFLPSNAQVEQFINQYTYEWGTDSVARYVASLRQWFFNLTSTTPSDAILTLPSTTIPSDISNVGGLRLWSQYSFNFTQWLSGIDSKMGNAPLSALIRLITSFLLISVFLNAVVSSFVHHFGLHSWDGVDKR